MESISKTSGRDSSFQSRCIAVGSSEQQDSNAKKRVHFDVPDVNEKSWTWGSKFCKDVRMMKCIFTLLFCSFPL